MGDSDSNPQPSKKRAAGVQLSRENPGLDDDNEEASEQEAGTFKRASEEVLATRRIVKVRRQQTSSNPSASDPPPASNPFGTIRLVPSVSAPSVEVEASGVTSKEAVETDRTNSKSDNVADETTGESSADAEPSESKVDRPEAKFDSAQSDIVGKQNIAKLADGKVEESVNSGNGAGETSEASNNENDKEDEEDKKNDDENAKTDAQDKKNDEEKGNGNVNTEKKTEKPPSFSSFQHLSSSQNAFSGLAQTGLSTASFTFGSVPQDRPALGSSSTSTSLSMQEVPVETGEENERAVFTSDSVLYEFIDGAWKERGKGELKVNVSTTGTGKARLVMRARGNYRLILNSSLFPEMKLTSMDKKGITFACVNTAGDAKDVLSTIALKFKDVSIVEDFRAAVMEHKTKPAVVLKTPENSPRRSAE